MLKAGSIVRLKYDPRIERKEFKDLQHWKILGIAKTRYCDLYIIKGLETGTVIYEKEEEIELL